MAHINTVLQSINSEDGAFCVDIFKRPDGSFGFDIFRRDAEDPSGWFPVGHFSDQVFDSPEAARMAATQNVSWFSPD